MVDGDVHPGVARLLREDGWSELLSILSERLTGADLTTLLLEVARRRARRLTPTEVLARYESDRFVAPATVDAGRLQSLEQMALDFSAPLFLPIVLSPVVPFGTHHALGGVDQNNVVTTMRATEVGADPTTALALEVAVRRRRVLRANPRSTELVRLAAVDRVVRAQRFAGPRSFAHFSLLGLVTAGRDLGSHRFEASALVEHVRTLAELAHRAGATRVAVRITDFGGGHGDVIDGALAALAGDRLSSERWDARTAARGYYPNVCFKLSATFDQDEIEIADGGMVDWTGLLLHNQKERLMISGLSLERLAGVGIAAGSAGIPSRPPA